jgi:hypothetical protein
MSVAACRVPAATVTGWASWPHQPLEDSGNGPSTLPCGGPAVKPEPTLGCDHQAVPVVAFLDESRRKTYHPILSVGGFVCDLADVPALEAAWGEAKADVGLAPDADIRYAMSWEDPACRLRLIERIPKLGVRLLAVAALLEDFRPQGMKEQKGTRKDIFIQKRAFEYVLQRLGEPQYLGGGGPGPHLVFADRHPDFKSYEEEYAKGWTEGWRFPSGRRIAPLRDLGFAACCASMSGGPAMEVADLIGSVPVRWAEAMVAADRGKAVPDREELDDAMWALLGLFPASSSIPPTWAGYSLIAHRGNYTGKEVIYRRIDQWLLNLLMTR